MDYSQHTTGSRSAIKRWLHRSRFEASLRLLNVQPHDRVLDYGCADGELSQRIGSRFPEVELVAYDPAEALYAQACRRLSHRVNITTTCTLDPSWAPFDRIACLETLEHLPGAELHTALQNIQSMLKDDGRCLFTFPIEHGFMALAKNCYRVTTGSDAYASLRQGARSLFGLSVPREAPRSLSGCRYIYSHAGFDCRAMVVTLGALFTIDRVKVLPAGSLRFGFGNTLAVLASKRATHA